MNGGEIARILTRDKNAKRVFCGVYPRDRLPRRIPKRPAAYVINTDPHNKPGEHWLALFFDRRGGVEYFDSYGFPPWHPEIKTFIAENSQKQAIVNTRPIQALQSIACGLYAVYFIIMRSRRTLLRRALVPFHPHRLLVNDRIVLKLLRSLGIKNLACNPR